jgi:hypothetical protein
MRMKGWYNESHRHYLAAKGIKTNKYYSHKRLDLADPANLPRRIGHDEFEFIKEVASPTEVEIAMELEQKNRGDLLAEKILDLAKGKEYYARKSTAKFSHHKPEQGREYPVTEKDVKKALKKTDAKGLTAVEFRNPSDYQQENAYAQYKRGRRALVIFSQPVVKPVGRTYFVEKQELIPKVEMKKAIVERVIPHEIDHHHILYRDRITDKDVEMAEARAEAKRRGYDYKDDAVVRQFIGASVV